MMFDSTRNQKEEGSMKREVYQNSEGESLCDVTLCHQDGRTLASICVRTAGHTHTGVASFVVAEEELELVLSDASWDCREWQWWKDYPYGDEKRPRLVPAISGYEKQDSEVQITSQYTCDGVRTSQEWLFRVQSSDSILTYDCRHTVSNCSAVDLVEYAQFFACYTETNREKSQFYWAKDKQFMTFLSLGGNHLDAYIVELGSRFERKGMIPHAVRGNGRVADTWYHPVLVGHPTPKGWRHIILTEPSTTAGLASGMGGIAMDYIAYPGTDVLKAGEKFSIHIRHHIAKMPDNINVEVVESLWEVFENDLQNSVFAW